MKEMRPTKNLFDIESLMLPTASGEASVALEKIYINKKGNELMYK